MEDIVEDRFNNMKDINVTDVPVHASQSPHRHRARNHDIHTPLMIINSMIFGFTVLVLILQNPDILARADVLWNNQCDETGGEIPCIQPSWSIMDVGNRTIGLTMSALLVSLFTMLLRFYRSLFDHGEHRRLNLLLNIMETLSAGIVTIMTSVNIGLFLQLTSATIQTNFPLYRVPKSTTTFSVALAGVREFVPEDPFHLLISKNGSDTVFLYGQIAYDWLKWNSVAYISLGVVLATLSLTPLMCWRCLRNV